VEQHVNFIVMNDVIIVILKNIGTFALTMFGVEMTIFTVVYSFIVSKRGYFKAITHEAKIQEKPSTYLNTEQKFAIEYMNKLKYLNRHIIILAIVSLVLYFVTLFIPYNNEDIIIAKHYIIGGISALYILYTLYILVRYLIIYSKEIKF
jgi:hypothetical protein